MSFHGFNIGDAMGALALWNDFRKAKAEKGGDGEKFSDFIKQRLPNWFGIGRVDEQLFESIRQLLSVPKRRLIDLVISEMRDYEADIFILTVTGMSCGSEIVDRPVKNPQKGQPATTKETVSWELTAKDLRVKYLKDIASEVSKRSDGLGEQIAAALVVADMRSRRLITRSPAAQKAYELWADATEWTKKNFLDFFNVDSLDEITDNVVAAKLDSKLEDLVRHHPNILSITPVVETVGGRVVVREQLQAQIPGVFSLMAADVRNFFNIFRRRP